MNHRRLQHLTSLITFALTGCPSPMPPPPEEPVIAAPEAPRIPWLAAGTPDIAPPEIPWLTDESACPPGWGWIEVAPGLNGCDPYPTGRIEDCGPTGAHFPGEAGCRDLDSGDTEWPSDLPATNVLYVLEGASGGDGTRTLPFATLPEALAVATEGATIALGPGRYDTGQGAELGPGRFDTLSKVRVAGLHLRGTSVTRTTLFSARPAPIDAAQGDVAMLVVEAADVEISDLRFESPHPALDVLAGGAATVRRVVLDGTFLGLSAEAGLGVFEDVVVTGCTGLAAVVAVGGGTVTLRRAVLRGPTTTAAYADGAGSSFVLEDVWAEGHAFETVAQNGARMEVTRLGARDTPQAVRAYGAGTQFTGRWLALDVRSDGATGALNVSEQAAVTLEDLVASGASPEGYLQAVVGADSDLSLDRGLLVDRGGVLSEGRFTARDLVAVADASEQYGVVARSGGTASLSRAQISATYGVYAEVDGRVEGTDLVLREAVAENVRGIGALASHSALTLERVRIERANAGVLALNDAEVTLADVAVLDVIVSNADLGAVGITAQLGARITGSRVAVERVEGIAVSTVMSGSLELEDLVVREAHGPPGTSAALVIGGDAMPSALTRLAIEDARERGLLLLGPTTLEDVSVRDVSAGSTGLPGAGLVIAHAVELAAPAVTGARIVVDDVDSIGVAVLGAGAGAAEGRVSVALTDVRIERAGTTAAGGAGVFASGEADLSLTHFVVRDAASVGVMSTTGATMTLVDGLVTTTATCTSSEMPLDLSTVLADACGTGPVTWVPPGR